MEKHLKILSGVVLLSVLLTAFVWIGTTYLQNASQQYTYEPAGFSFTYGPEFVLEEKNLRDNLHEITIVHEDVLLEDKTIVAGEFGHRMHCWMFNNRKDLSLSEWMNTPDYQLYHSVIEGTTYPSADIPGVEALGFKTDGLYSQDHVAFEHNGYLIDCFVDYRTLDDLLRMQFATLISTIRLSSN